MAKKVKKSETKAKENVNSKEISKAAKEKDDVIANAHEKALEMASKYVDKSQVEKAVMALVKHDKLYRQKVMEKKTKLDLLADDPEDDKVDDTSQNTRDFVLVQFAVKSGMKVAKLSFKMHPVKISHPMYSLTSDLDICLLVKDKKEAKKWLEEQPVPMIKKVIDLQALRTKYATFKHRRELHATYNVFLADDRIITMLPKTLGNIFMKSHKRPLPLRLAQSAKVDGQLEQRVSRALTSAYFQFSGICCVMRAARITAPIDHIIDNVVDCIAGAAAKYPGGWGNIQNIHIKTGASAALPVYMSLPVDGANPDDEQAEPETPKQKKRKSISKAEETKTPEPDASSAKKVKKVKTATKSTTKKKKLKTK